MKTILLVENDLNLGALYEEELSDGGYHVLRAGDGRQGVEMANYTQPDIVVLDINMPDMDGIEALERMLGEQPHLPVVINSGHDSYKDSFRSWSAAAFVLKSSDLSELKSQIYLVLAAQELKEQELTEKV
jgi:DNA-binding response OmpR family regulator